jgi:hypothetical protein
MSFVLSAIEPSGMVIFNTLINLISFFIPEMETALLKKASYEAAQAANEEFFVTTNKQVDEAYKDIESDYVNHLDIYDWEIEAELIGMTSRSRILLMRRIIQKLADDKRNQVSIL